MRPTAEALALVSAFAASPEEEKSRELILSLLEFTPAPFSRDQFHPGHVTCTAVVLHPGGGRVLLMHHHRHHRWLLPGGHVEGSDVTLSDTARREAMEETAVVIAEAGPAALAGMDVHAIPARKGEPPSPSRSDLCVCGNLGGACSQRRSSASGLVRDGRIRPLSTAWQHHSRRRAGARNILASKIEACNKVEACEQNRSR